MSDKLSMIDFVMSLSNLGVVGFLAKLVYSKLANSASKEELEELKEELEKKIDNEVNQRFNSLVIKIDNINEKLDDFKTLVLKDTKLTFKD